MHLTEESFYCFVDLRDLYIKRIIAIIIREKGTIGIIESIRAEHTVIYNINSNKIGVILRIAFGFIFF